MATRLARASFLIGLCVALGSVPAARAQERRPQVTGALLLAHGGSAQWNSHVTGLAAALDQTVPVEVAFGMASRRSIQSAIDRLTARGVTDIVAVPLFVSSWSSVVTSTEYLLGLRAEAPPDLAMFARMDHAGHGSHAPAASHVGHEPEVAPTSPVTTTARLRMGPALNRHPLVGRILADRARSISLDPTREAVVLVAHGPVPDDDNRRWLGDMEALAAQVQAASPYAAVHYLTVRDDAGPALREAATRELRGIVEHEIEAGRRVLVVPHLLSFGGIERGIRTRLDGLAYTMTEQALMPDPRIAEWVLEQVALSAAGRPEGPTLRVNVDDGVIVFGVAARGHKAVTEGGPTSVGHDVSQHPDQHRLLRVQPVLRLGEDHRRR